MPLIGTFIVPHPPLLIKEIGRGQEFKVKKTIGAYEKVAYRIKDLKPDIIILTTPHSVLYSDYIHISPGKSARGDFKEFGEKSVSMEVDYDIEFVRKLTLLAEKKNIPAGTLGEKNKNLDHGTMVPLYFINRNYNDYKLVRISISRLSALDHYKFGKCIAQLASESDKNILIVASGDLSHMLKDEGPYGYAEEGVIFDREVTKAISNGDFLSLLNFDEDFCDAAGECGLRSFIIMAGALDGKEIKSELLSYEGPFGVGYAVAAFTIIGEDENRHFDDIFEFNEVKRLNSLKEEEDDYVRLARLTLENYVIKHKKFKITEDLKLEKELLEKRAGVFVSLKMDGKLRGCIGTISPTTSSIADEIIQNAISSGLEDPRFYPVSEDELSKLEYSVDVLGEAEKIESMDELDPKSYGVIVSLGNKRGLLLPNLEGVNTSLEQVNIALQKAGILPNEKYSLERFEVVRHK